MKEYLAGKLHALLQRSYTKGRDLYDLLWYLSDPNWPAPNLTLLNNALRQTGRSESLPTEDDWRTVVRVRLEALNWEQAVTEVRPFLEPGADVGLLTRDTVLKVLGG